MSREFVDAIITDNNLEAETAFKDAIATKVGGSLENKRRELSKSFVKTQVEVENESDI